MSFFFYSEKEENIKGESINNYANIFSEYLKNPPNLQSALQQMFIKSGLPAQNVNPYIEDIYKKTNELMNKNFNKIRLQNPNINAEDFRIISSYTCESSYDANFSPYKLLNTNLVSEDRQLGIRNISKYLFLFLNSLRKLKRVFPSKKFLYRCIRQNVQINYDIFNPKIVPYIAGNNKIFWGFTSTSPNVQMTYDFLKTEENKNKTGTIFTLTGKIWGYDITLFNFYGEDEILLEPERKFVVEQVLPPLNGVIYIRCVFQETPLVLKDLFNKKIIVQSFNEKNVPRRINSNKIEVREVHDNSMNNGQNRNFVDVNDIISVNFVSANLNINYNIRCSKTTKFEKCKQKLLEKFPELKNNKLFFLANRIKIDESKTMDENKIKSGNIILINFFAEYVREIPNDINLIFYSPNKSLPTITLKFNENTPIKMVIQSYANSAKIPENELNKLVFIYMKRSFNINSIGTIKLNGLVNNAQIIVCFNQ